MDVRVWAAIERAYLDQLRVYDAFQANIAGSMSPDGDRKKFLLVK